MRIFYIVLAVLYGAWFWWYGGRGEPVTHEEVKIYLAKVADNFRGQGVELKEEFYKQFESLAITDDGNEFYMVNLIRWRDKALYPSDSPWADDPDPMAANARYNAGVMPAVIRNGGMPVFVGDPSGRFMEDGDVRPWDTFAIVRYRSVRDMLEMVSHPSMAQFGIHKGASIEETHVFPVRADISLVMVRTTVALVFVGLALLVTGIARLRKK